MATSRAMMLPQTGQPRVIRNSSNYLYSKANLPTALAVGDYDLFAVGIGTIGQGFAFPLTPTQTNLRTGGRVPDQQKFRMKQIGFAFDSSVILSDQKKILDNCYLWLDKPDLRYIFGPPMYYPGGVGISGATNVLAAEAMNNGWASVTARVRLNQAIELDPGESFTIKMSVTAAQALDFASVVSVLLWGDNKTRVVSQ